MEQLRNTKRVRDDSDESEFDSPEVKRLRDDLLGNLDDSDLWATSPDLDSFMKIFYEEISPPTVDLTAEPDECPPDFSFLLEASDHELGLPPSNMSSSTEDESKKEVDLVRVSSNSLDEVSELWRFDDQIPSYDSFDFGHGVNYDGNDNGEVGAIDGVFDYSSDLGFGLYDGRNIISEKFW